MGLTYSVAIPQLADLRQAFIQAPVIVRGQINDAINRSLVKLQADAKQLAPVKTGHLYQSIQITPAEPTSDLMSGKVGTSVKYAVWTERGTGIYGPYASPIVPTSKKALAFTLGGQSFVRRSVKGMRGRFYMKQALEMNTLVIQTYFQTALDTALKLIAIRKATP
jgi:hypothetical protein